MFLLSFLQFVGVLCKFVLTAERKLDIMTLVRVYICFRSAVTPGDFALLRLANNILLCCRKKFSEVVAVALL
nr:MAG TPA: hypothetical protein [Caudoviricetes sp.]